MTDDADRPNAEVTQYETYRGECHVDGCTTRFIGISRGGYVEHLREKHGELTGTIWDKLVIDNAE